MIIAPGKQSVARGYGRKMISSFFPSDLVRLRRAKSEGKKEAEREGSLPRAAAPAALPGAIILAPPPGLRRGEPAELTRIVFTLGKLRAKPAKKPAGRCMPPA